MNVQTSTKTSKKHVNEKFRSGMWKNASKKKEYYIAKFNPTYDHKENVYINAKIKWKEKILIAQIRTSSHRLDVKQEDGQHPKSNGKTGYVCYAIKGQ